MNTNNNTPTILGTSDRNDSNLESNIEKQELLEEPKEPKSLILTPVWMKDYQL